MCMSVSTWQRRIWRNKVNSHWLRIHRPNIPWISNAQARLLYPVPRLDCDNEIIRLEFRVPQLQQILHKISRAAACKIHYSTHTRRHLVFRQPPVWTGHKCHRDGWSTALQQNWHKLVGCGTIPSSRAQSAANSTNGPRRLPTDSNSLQRRIAIVCKCSQQLGIRWDWSNASPPAASSMAAVAGTNRWQSLVTCLDIKALGKYGLLCSWRLLQLLRPILLEQSSCSLSLKEIQCWVEKKCT